nr:hypothetical protein BaRGS_019539 [Batillaria attramentaria]
MASKEAAKDLVTEAKNFTRSLANVFLLKKRDQQSKHLLEKAQALIDALVAENQKLSAGSSTPRQMRAAGGMGQLWVKLDELKRENDDLRRQRSRPSSDERASSSPKDKQGPGDVIIGELHKTKGENESLKAQVAQLQKSVRELQSVNATMQDEYKRSKAALDAAQRSVEKARQDYKKLEASFTSTKTENDSLKQKMTSSVKPMMRTDNRLTENINERCRPSTVAMRYNTLESQQWVDAKEAIEDGPGSDLDEDKIVGLLCDSLMSTYNACRQLYTNVELVMSELMKRPTLATEVVRSGLIPNCQPAPLSDDLTDLVKQKLRQATDSVDTDIICSSRARKVDMFVWPVLYDYENGNVMVKGCVIAS